MVTQQQAYRAQRHYKASSGRRSAAIAGHSRTLATQGVQQPTAAGRSWPPQATSHLRRPRFTYPTPHSHYKAFGHRSVAFGHRSVALAVHGRTTTTHSQPTARSSPPKLATASCLPARVAGSYGPKHAATTRHPARYPSHSRSWPPAGQPKPPAASCSQPKLATVGCRPAKAGTEVTEARWRTYRNT